MKNNIFFVFIFKGKERILEEWHYYYYFFFCHKPLLLNDF